MSELREILKSFHLEYQSSYGSASAETDREVAYKRAEQSIRSHFEAKVGECRVLPMSDLYGGEIIDKSDIIARIREESK